jgi:hypothetical protein
MNPPDRNPYDPPPSGEVETTDVEFSTDGGSCLAILFGIWLFGGAMLYVLMFFAPGAPDSNIWQRIFVAVLCGPLAWLAVIYELLGMIGN